MNDATRIYNQGRQFLLAGERCFELRPVNGSAQALPIAGTVNMAFAIELFLKALLVNQSNQAPKTHGIKSLVDELVPETRDQVETHYSASGSDEFDEVVEFVDHLFTRIRYLHEYMGEAQEIWRPSVGDLARAIAKVCGGQANV